MSDLKIPNGYEEVKYEKGLFAGPGWQCETNDARDRGPKWTDMIECNLWANPGMRVIRPVGIDVGRSASGLAARLARFNATLADAPKPEPSMRCPNCGSSLIATCFALFDIVRRHVFCTECGTAGAFKDNDAAALAAFSRIRMEPEPMRCPNAYPKVGVTCASCRFFYTHKIHKVQVNDLGGRLESDNEETFCRRFPKQESVRPSAWCGEYLPRKEGA